MSTRLTKLAALVTASGFLIVGSAFAAPGRSLFADVRASAVGDLVTIIVIESTQASRSASTQSSRSGGVSFDASVSSADSVTANSGGGRTGSEHEGSGVTQSSGALRTTVTALVSELLPNGYLQISGSRQLQINDEKETLTVSGLVRPEDISPANTVLSTQLADADISYTGEGWIAKQQKPNIFLRILSGILPFF